MSKKKSEPEAPALDMANGSFDARQAGRGGGRWRFGLHGDLYFRGEPVHWETCFGHIVFRLDECRLDVRCTGASLIEPGYDRNTMRAGTRAFERGQVREAQTARSKLRSHGVKLKGKAPVSGAVEAGIEGHADTSQRTGTQDRAAEGTRIIDAAEEERPVVMYQGQFQDGWHGYLISHPGGGDLISNALADETDGCLGTVEGRPGAAWDVELRLVPMIKLEHIDWTASRLDGWITKTFFRNKTKIETLYRSHPKDKFALLLLKDGAELQRLAFERPARDPAQQEDERWR